MALLMLSFVLARNVGCPPTCRQCRFDLSGISITSSSRCPECGASLKYSWAVQRHRARWNWWCLIPAALLIVSGPVVAAARLVILLIAHR